MVQLINVVELVSYWLKFRRMLYVKKKKRSIWKEPSVDAATWLILSRSGYDCLLTQKKWKLHQGIDYIRWEKLPVGKVWFWWFSFESYFSGMNLSAWLGHFSSHSDTLFPLGFPRVQSLAFFCSHFDSIAEHLRSFIQEVISISMTNTWRLFLLNLPQPSWKPC